MSDDLTTICDLITERRQPNLLRRHVVDLLDGIASGSRTFRALYHPLEFVYVPLLRGDGWTLRLHIWLTDVTSGSSLSGGTHGNPLPNKAGGNSPYHAHTWDLKSYVLLGDLENQLVHADQTAIDPLLRVYKVVGQGDVDLFERTDAVVRPEIESSERVHEGEMYGMASGKYHTTLNPSGGALVTVAFIERVPGTEEQVLGPLDGASHSYVRQTCPSEDLQEHAARTLAALPEARRAAGTR